MPDRISFDSVIMHREDETDEVCLCKDIVGGSCVVLRLLYNEELDVLESKQVVGSICAALSVLVRPEEEEEGDPGEVSDGFFSWGGSLGDGIQGLDNINRERPHSCWRRIVFLIGLQLKSQPKFKFSHAVVAGAIGPHGCKYLTNGVEVLLDLSLLDGLPLHGQKPGMYTLGENLEESNRVFDAFEVGGDVKLAAEALPLAPESGIFIKDCGGEARGDCFLCSIVVCFQLHTYYRGRRRQVLLCRKCVWKWERN